jgi:hypothetical protein
LETPERSAGRLLGAGERGAKARKTDLTRPAATLARAKERHEGQGRRETYPAGRRGKPLKGRTPRASLHETGQHGFGRKNASRG